MRHLGDYDTSTVIYGKFTTFRPSTGAAYTLGGTPALSVYKDNSTTQSTTGVTLTADFDTVTGLNHFAIDTSADGTFYSAGSFFDIVITTGTVDSVSVVGSVVASFTLRKDSALKPTTAGRTLAVDASGHALGDVDTIKTQTVTCAAGVTVLASVGTAATSTAQTGDAYARLGAPAGASVSADIAAVKAETASIVDDTGTSGVVVAPASKTGYGLAAGGAGSGAIAAAELNNIADAILDRNMATGTDSGTTAIRTVRQALRVMRNKVSISAGTATIYKEDDVTSSWTAAVTTTAGDPISAVDPAGP